MSEEKFVPPKAAQNNGKKAIEWKEKYGDQVKAMTQTGWTRARQLADGDALSFDVVKRMSNFNRHRKNAKIAPEHKDEPWKDNGHVAWLGWGGDAGVDWAMKIVDRVEKEKNESVEEDDDPCWDGYERVPGTKKGTKGSCRKKGSKKKDENMKLTKQILLLLNEELPDNAKIGNKYKIVKVDGETFRNMTLEKINPEEATLHFTSKKGNHHFNYVEQEIILK